MVMIDEAAIPYTNRNDLTRMEILAINHYKDLINPQFSWDYAPEEQIYTGIDCHIVNNILRNNKNPKEKLRYDNLTQADKIRYTRIEKHVESAIRKSPLPYEKLRVVKGIKPFSDLTNYKEGDIISDLAFSSYTESKEKAFEYSMKNENGEYVFFYLTLKRGDLALYVDTDEEEWLIICKKHLAILSINHYGAGEWIDEGKAIVYYLKLLT